MDGRNLCILPSMIVTEHDDCPNACKELRIMTSVYLRTNPGFSWLVSMLKTNA